MKESNELKVGLGWKWFPYYAASVIGNSKTAQNLESLKLLGTKSSRPYGDLELVAKQPIKWLEEGQQLTWTKLGLDVPDVFICSGWAEQSFLSLAEDCKRNGGQVVVMVDNRWRGDWRQKVGALVYRLRYSRIFDAAWVPGASGRKLMRYFGVPNNRIFEGLYGANLDLFSQAQPVSLRPKRFLFVGALIERKGLRLLAEAWKQFKNDKADWELIICGNGDVPDYLMDIKGIRIHPFTQPAELVEVYQSSRCLVLPSYDENWGLVVHEAIACGCGVIASSAVGSALDFSKHDVCSIFTMGDANSLYQKMQEFASLDEAGSMLLTENTSQARTRFGPHCWDSSLQQILTELG